MCAAALVPEINEKAFGIVLERLTLPLSYFNIVSPSFYQISSDITYWSNMRFYCLIPDVVLREEYPSKALSFGKDPVLIDSSEARIFSCKLGIKKEEKELLK